VDLLSYSEQHFGFILGAATDGASATYCCAHICRRDPGSPRVWRNSSIIWNKSLIGREAMIGISFAKKRLEAQ
jgi:hypothetical protein